MLSKDDDNGEQEKAEEDLGQRARGLELESGDTDAVE